MANILQRIGNFFGRGYNQPTAPIATIEAVEKQSTNSVEGSPIAAGRQSQPNLYGAALMDNISTIKPDIPSQYLAVLEILATSEPDLSFAVENITQMGNTPYTVDFGDEVKEAEAGKMRKVLNVAGKRWYSQGNNKVSLIASMLDQVSINGAQSAEAVIMPDLSGIQQIVLVPPKYIEFKYDSRNNFWQPYQKATNLVIPIATNDLGYIKLNPKTYKYTALKTRGEKPYGVPPLFAALESSGIEKSVIDGFAKTAKNVGILGFLQILVNRPERKKSLTGDYLESDSEYNQRCLTYLNTMIRPEAEKGFNTGVMTGFKSDFEMKFEGATSQGIKGAKDFVEVVTVKKLAGLKQDPVLLGRPFNTSEAFARMILDKFAAQVSSMQETVACTLAEFFKLELVLNGFPYINLTVTFQKPNVKDELKSEQAYSAKIDNLDKLFQQGIISQTQRANELGYDKPFLDEPIQAQANTSQNNELALESIISNLGYNKGIPFDYDFDTTCCKHEAFANGDDDFDEKVKAYFGDMSRVYQTAIKKIAAKVGSRIASMSNSSTEDQVFKALYATVLRNWDNDYIEEYKPIVSKWVSEIYRFFREDKSIFPNKRDIPKATFDSLDLRTINYMKKGDNFYLGKFITDDDTQNRLKNWFLSEWEKGDIPLGQTGNQAAFIKNMAAQLGLEEYKIQRVVATTTNKIKSYAGISYLEQANIEKFEIVALLDNKTSDICRKMDGKIFSVAASRARVLKVSKSDPKEVPEVTPFVSSVFKDLDDLDDLTGDELLSDYKIFAPPFHGNCRTQVVAVV